MCPDGWTKACQFLYDWQALVAGLMALFAALLGVAYLHKQIRQTQQIEDARRARKLAALRAVGPLALSSIIEYVTPCTKALKALYRECGDDHALPKTGVGTPVITPLPQETVALLSEFIEYSESSDADLIEELMRDLQVLSARLRGLASDITNPNVMVTKRNIEERLLDAGVAYAKASAGFGFFRRMSKKLPPDITWENVRAALRNMDVYEQSYPGVYEGIDRLASQSTGPKRWADRAED